MKQKTKEQLLGLAIVVFDLALIVVVQIVGV
jgi:hypothetical protein